MKFIFLFVCLYFIAIDIKCHCMMGLFSEIGRAWLTIDSDIYVSSLNFCVKPNQIYTNFSNLSIFIRFGVMNMDVM